MIERWSKGCKHKVNKHQLNYEKEFNLVRAEIKEFGPKVIVLLSSVQCMKGSFEIIKD